MNSAIELNNLYRNYGPHHILENLNLTISQGKIVALHGSNGTGKTTLLKVLSTKLKPSRGTGKVFDFDLYRKAYQIRHKIAYLSVLGGSYGVLSALENLQLANRLYNKFLTTKALEGYLDKVDLLKSRHQLVRTFSSGMKKRLAIARFLLANAPLWLLDEPYVALDEQGQKLIDDLLIRAKAEGKTVIMASQ